MIMIFAAPGENDEEEVNYDAAAAAAAAAIIMLAGAAPRRRPPDGDLDPDPEDPDRHISHFLVPRLLGRTCPNFATLRRRCRRRRSHRGGCPS